MKRRIWLLIGLGVPVSLLIAFFVVRKANADRDEAAFQAQLRLAREEGLSTTWQEFAATIPTAAPSENAAPLYRTLRQIKRNRTDKRDLNAIDLQLIFHPGATTRSDAATLLAAYRDELGVADKAVLLPKCWFDRDWSQGLAVLMPEFADMKQVARAVALRGSLAADRGNVDAAIADARRVFAIARHAGQETTQISHLVGEAIYLIGVRDLAFWSLVHRDRPAYREALEKALDDIPQPDVRVENRSDLFCVLSVIDLCATPEGRKELGLREEDIGAGEKIFPLLISRSQARIRIVKAERSYWAALSRPRAERASLISDARMDLNMALLAFPTAATVYSALNSGADDGATDREAAWQARKLQYVALLRALRDPKTTPRKIKTSDLLSPFDGKPLTYTFDGAQIVISVSGYANDSGPAQLKVPPDKALGK